MHKFEKSKTPSNLQLLDFCRKFAAVKGGNLPMYETLVAIQAGVEPSAMQDFSGKLARAIDSRNSKELSKLLNELGANSEMEISVMLRCENPFLAAMLNNVAVDVFSNMFIKSLADYCLEHTLALCETLSRISMECGEDYVVFSFKPLNPPASKKPEDKPVVH